VDELALAAGELYDQLGDLTHRVLDGVAYVDGLGRLLFGLLISNKTPSTRSSTY
jgi:hypothetical protein